MGVRISPGAPSRRHRRRAGRPRGDRTLTPPRDAAAGAPPPGDPSAIALPGGLEGFLGPRRILGWAADPDAPPGTPLGLLVRLRGQEVARLATGGHGMPELFAAVGAAHGFLLDLPAGYAIGDLSGGRLGVHPLRDGQPQAPLPVRPRLVAQEQAAAGHAMLARAEEALGGKGLAEMLAVLGRPQGFGATRLAAEANAALAAAIPGNRPRDVGLSPLWFPVGLRSADGQVVMGRDGHLFLLAGSNGEVARLGEDPAQRDRLVEAWCARIEARRTRCAAAGIRFVQLIVPEKSSLVPDLLPDPTQGGPSPVLLALEEAVAADPRLAACTVSGLGALRAAARARQDHPAAMVRRLDSHPSPAGMHALARAVLARLGAATPDLGTRFVRPRLGDGDLRVHFLPEPCFEEVPHAPDRALARFGAEPALVEAHVPEHGGHVGRWELARTAGAPSPARLLAFGNSVCGTVAARQNLLSGWLARWFAEYRFHWQPELDWAAVEASRPDIVLCQTVERFMGRVPEA